MLCTHIIHSSLETVLLFCQFHEFKLGLSLPRHVEASRLCGDALSEHTARFWLKIFTSRDLPLCNDPRSLWPQMLDDEDMKSKTTVTHLVILPNATQCLMK